MDLADNFNEKKQHDEARNNFDRVLTAIYQLGRNGHLAVSLETLQQYAGLKKLDVLSVIEEATGKDWTIDAGTNVVAITHRNWYSSFCGFEPPGSSFLF
ncbi:MAG TPA: hypothetical protein PKU94_08845 [Candidatus Hydrothermia bacterium]|nr:hypothetical protein [Candidatus Hydrothermia bacterium]